MARVNVQAVGAVQRAANNTAMIGVLLFLAFMTTLFVTGTAPMALGWAAIAVIAASMALLVVRRRL